MIFNPFFHPDQVATSGKPVAQEAVITDRLVEYEISIGSNPFLHHLGHVRIPWYLLLCEFMITLPRSPPPQPPPLL